MKTTLTPPQAENITLYYREGSSDKVYQCSLEPRGELFVVNFAYGRRGATLNTGTKTSSPVEFEAAKKIYDKLVQEKTAKGYTPGESGTPYQHTDNANRTTGILPQLLNPIEEQDVTLLVTDKSWCMQEKKDGRRNPLKKQGQEVIGINRKGLVVALPLPLAQAALVYPGDFVMDGESIGDELHVFDLLEQDGKSLASLPYRDRLVALLNLFGSGQQRQIHLVETAFTTKQKAALLKRLRKEKREGVVFKRLDAPYTPGRPNSGGTQLKHKFCATLSAVVGKINAQRSVEIRLLHFDGWVPAGNVTIPPNHKVPKVGAVIEVRFLYAHRESGCLYQPVYLGPRTDIEQHECGVSQLKFKPNEEDEL